MLTKCHSITWQGSKGCTKTCTQLNLRAVVHNCIEIKYYIPPPPTQQILTQVLWKFRQMQHCTLLLIAPFFPKAELVFEPSDPVQENLNSSTSLGQAVETTQVKRVSPKPKNAQSSCLETVQVSIEDRGFEENYGLSSPIHSQALLRKVENL